MAARMRRSSRQELILESANVLSLSFLDVLSCGLGAAIYLFLVFSIMPHIGTTIGSVAGARSSPGMADAVGSKAMREGARNVMVFVDIRLENLVAGKDPFPADPWESTLPSRAHRFQPGQLQAGSMVAAAQMNARHVRGKIKVVVNPDAIGPTTKARLTVTMGGTSRSLPAWTFVRDKLGAENGVVAEIDLLSGNPDTWIIPKSGVK